MSDTYPSWVFTSDQVRCDHIELEKIFPKKTEPRNESFHCKQYDKTRIYSFFGQIVFQDITYVKLIKDEKLTNHLQ